MNTHFRKKEFILVLLLHFFQTAYLLPYTRAPYFRGGASSCEVDESRDISKKRHASDLITDLVERSDEDGADESQELLYLVAERTAEYLETLHESKSSPRKLLHFLAPKVPAIRHSPDVALRIRSARSEMDSGLAAAIIAALAHVNEAYEKEYGKKSEFICDRRFEQLVECVLCGVNVLKYKGKYVAYQQSNCTKDIQEILGEEWEEVDEGLSLGGCCRAAWGLSILDTHHCGAIGGENVSDLLNALSFRAMDLLLARLRLLQSDDLCDHSGNSISTLHERVRAVSVELAADTASVMWSFACVKACTGLRSDLLMEVCTWILLQDPLELRRRAQEAQSTLKSSNVGSDDVIDRLAKSERTEEQSSKLKETNQLDRSMGCLLEWLSPNELTDSVWALALHGSASPHHSDEVELLRIISSFRDLAVDRMLGWLTSELRSSQSTESVAQGSCTEVDRTQVSDFDTQAIERNGIDEDPVQNAPLPLDQLDLQSSCLPGNVDESVETIEHNFLAVQEDEGTLPEIKAVNDEIDELEDVPVEDQTYELTNDVSAEVATATVAFRNTEVADSESTGSGPLRDAQEFSSQTLKKTKLKYLTTRDLCSIAWAVTEMDVTSRCTVVKLVVQILDRVGEPAVRELSGRDLSNLAWALAKVSVDSRLTPAEIQSVESIMAWIAAQTLEVIKAKSDVTQETALSFSHFQPQELSRLLWSVAVVFSIEPSKIASCTYLSQLGRCAIVMATSSMSLFEVDDMARFAWAYMVLSSPSGSEVAQDSLRALGKCIAMIETSLHQWERGKLSAAKMDDDSSHQQTSTFLFGSLFGRPLLQTRLFDHHAELPDEFDEFHFPSYVQKVGLPLLRDLPVDPSTLCKLCCSLAQTECANGLVVKSKILRRVAMRLFSSRNGRLLRSCTGHDLVKLCDVAARTCAHSERELVGLFTRRVVHRLNEMNGSDHDDCLSVLYPVDIALLVSALGELGVKYNPYDADVAVAHRRLILTVPIPLPGDADFLRLPLESQAELLQGIVCMSIHGEEPERVKDILLLIEKNMPFVSSSKALADMACAVAELKSALTIDLDSPVVVPEDAAKTDGVTEMENETAKTPQEDTEDLNDGVIEKTESASARARVTELLETCNQFLHTLAIVFANQLQTVPLNTLSRVLTAYTSIPLQVDGFMELVSTELVRRESALNATGVSILDFDELLLYAASTATAARRLLSGDKEQNSRFAKIRNGIRAFFRETSSLEKKESGNMDDPAELEVEQLVSNIKEALQTVIDLADRFEGSVVASGQQATRSIRAIDREALIELGRCKELVAEYYQVDFEHGTRKNQHDKEIQRKIMKRILSRRLP